MTWRDVEFAGWMLLGLIAYLGLSIAAITAVHHRVHPAPRLRLIHTHPDVRVIPAVYDQDNDPQKGRTA